MSAAEAEVQEESSMILKRVSATRDSVAVTSFALSDNIGSDVDDADDEIEGLLLLLSSSLSSRLSSSSSMGYLGSEPKDSVDVGFGFQ